MAVRQMRTRLPLIAAILIVSWTGSAQAASFSIVYDDSPNQLIENVVGTGMFSYDGSPTVGAFALSSLTGVSFTANFPGVTSFSTTDVISDLALSGIVVFDAGGGQLGLVFTGDQFQASDGFLLSHEETDALNNPVGCCGGDGSINQYFLTGTVFPELIYWGDYRARTPEPASLALLGLGLAGIAWRRARKR